MSAIALPAFHITTTRRHTVECPYPLQQDLEAYRAFYKQCYGADVAEPDLIREMVRAFIDNDVEFRRFKAEQTKPRTRSRSRGSDNGKRTNGSPLSPAGAAAGGA